jgi:hypothetical protein
MSLGPSEFERIRRALAEADVDEPLTAREIQRALEERGIEVESSHRIATVLGRQARRGDVEVIEDQPYRYRIQTGRDGGDRPAASEEWNAVR